MKQEVKYEQGKEMGVLNAGGNWDIFVNGQPVAVPANGEITGTFGKGTVAVVMSPGGSVAVAGTDGRLRFRRTQRALFISYPPEDGTLKKGEAVDITLLWMGLSGSLTRERVMETVKDFGLLVPGTVGYTAKVKRGQTTDSYLFWRANAKDGAFEATVRQAKLENFVPLALDGLNDNWSVFLVDRKRPAGKNFRAIPVRDGRAYANLDVIEGDADFFVGHPVVASDPNVTVLVAWKSSGKWFVEAHNPGDKPVKVSLTANKGWTHFRFKESLTLAPGSSQVWEVKGK
jgi:hypothetical protein